MSTCFAPLLAIRRKQCRFALARAVLFGQTATSPPAYDALTATLPNAGEARVITKSIYLGSNLPMARRSAGTRPSPRKNGYSFPASSGHARPVVVTTSWDDGHKFDLRLADLLRKYGLSGTFYVSPASREFDKQELLTPDEIRTISRDFEIGSHTLTHPLLPDIPLAEAAREIAESKLLLESITASSITSFCYPRGAYLPAHRDLVKAAGYQFARTVARHEFGLDDPYQAPTSIHAYNHWTDLWKIARFSKFSPMRFVGYCHWGRLSNAMFDHITKVGGIYHLWGHSWEIDAHDDWRQLDSALRYLSGRPGVMYLTNGELGSSMQQAQGPAE